MRIKASFNCITLLLLACFVSFHCHCTFLKFVFNFEAVGKADVNDSEWNKSKIGVYLWRLKWDFIVQICLNVDNRTVGQMKNLTLLQKEKVVGNVKDKLPGPEKSSSSSKQIKIWRNCWKIPGWFLRISFVAFQLCQFSFFPHLFLKSYSLRAKSPVCWDAPYPV